MKASLFFFSNSNLVTFNTVKCLRQAGSIAAWCRVLFPFSGKHGYSHNWDIPFRGNSTQHLRSEHLRSLSRVQIPAIKSDECVQKGPDSASFLRRSAWYAWKMPIVCHHISFAQQVRCRFAGLGGQHLGLEAQCILRVEMACKHLFNPGYRPIPVLIQPHDRSLRP